jgi:hypothetical protein
MSIASGLSGAVLAVNTETPRVLRDPKLDIHIIPELLKKKKENRNRTTINANNLIINIS